MRHRSAWLLVAMVWLVAIAPARAEERVRVALLPVVVHSADGREYLQQGMADMLVSRLGRDHRLAVIPVEDANTATTAVDAARKTGAANNADFVVFGSFTRFGEGASLDLSVASVHDTQRDPRKIYVHADTMGALLPLLDGVAERTTFAVLGGGPAEPGVAAGPANAASADAADVQDLRRRVEALERAVYDTGPTAKPTPGETSGKAQSGSRKPGLPTDREGDHLR